MTTIYPTFNWKSFALNLARAVEEKDEDAMHDLVKDARLYDAIPCPSITIGGPDGGKWPSAPEAGGSSMLDGPHLERYKQAVFFSDVELTAAQAKACWEIVIRTAFSPKGGVES